MNDDLSLIVRSIGFLIGAVLCIPFGFVLRSLGWRGFGRYMKGRCDEMADEIEYRCRRGL